MHFTLHTLKQVWAWSQRFPRAPHMPLFSLALFPDITNHQNILEIKHLSPAQWSKGALRWCTEWMTHGAVEPTGPIQCMNFSCTQACKHACRHQWLSDDFDVWSFHWDTSQSSFRLLSFFEDFLVECRCDLIFSFYPRESKLIVFGLFSTEACWRVPGLGPNPLSETRVAQENQNKVRFCFHCHDECLPVIYISPEKNYES